MVSQRQARYIPLLVVLMFLVQVIPIGQANSILAEEPQSHSTAKIIAYGSGIATALLSFNRSKATVLFSSTDFTHNTFNSFVRVDKNDSLLAQSEDQAIAIAPNGDIIVVWSQRNLSYSHLLVSLSSDQGESFSLPMSITGAATGNQTGPEIAVSNGVIYVVWAELVPGKDTDIFLAKSIDNGLSFNDPIRVDHTGSGRSIQGFPEVASRDNDVFVAWHDNRNGVLNIYGAFSHDQGQTFGPAGDVKISDDPGNTEQSRPDLVYLEDGRVLVIWQDRRTGDYDVRGAISTSGTTFSSSFLISEGPSNKDQSDPRLTIDPRGFVSVTWRDNRYVAGYHIFMRTSLDGVHYGISKRVDDAPMATTCFSPDIAVSQNGSVFVAWSDDRTGTSEVYFKAYPNLAPIVTISSPVKGAARKGSFPIIGGASDPEGSPQLSVEAQLQDSDGANLTPWSNASLSIDGTWRTRINSSHFANGTTGNYRIAARSFDGLVYSAIAMVNVTFDNVRPPYVELTLTADRVQFNPNDPMALQNVSIIAEVNNIGTMNATDVLVRFSWLNDSTHLPEIISERLLPSVPSGDHATALVNWTSFQGNVTILVEVDPANAIDEDNELNNNVSKAIHVEPSRPDILVASSDITIYPDLIYSGDSVNFSAVIANQGEKVGSNFDVTFNVSDIPISTMRIGELLPHHSVTLEVNWIAVGGPFTLHVRADPQHLMDDANFDNNVADVAFEVIPFERPLPDLTIANGAQLINPSEPMVGQNVTFIAAVSNIGNDNATDVNVTFYLDGELLAYRSIPQIDPAETVSVSSVNWLAVLGAHELRVEIDPHHAIIERNATNNIVSKQFTVRPFVSLIADLAVVQSNISMNPANPVMGNVVYINVTVQNLGNGSAENVLIVGKMDGQQVGLDKHIPYFAAHSITTVSFTWFANEGEHTFQISIDPDSNITESSKANNNASRTFQLSGQTDMTSIAVAGVFFLAAIGVVAFYLLRLRKK